ncbi:beta-ketoacyl-ACP synthase III [Lentzea sp. NPDC058450]|uniref:beta-ketoacyl-ACP synthase III n=1 Tax=Lentzea sp. NPDC058450 TaxID=3346505 RepID=UPI00366A2E6A
MSGSRVVALGHYQPERVLTNADLEKMVDTNDEWILQRTGIATRRIAAEKETVADMATEAGANALKASGLAPSDIGQVIVATCSAIDRSPSTAAQVAARLAIPSAVVFDLNNACAGFCTALSTADHTLRAGAAKHALVIGAEKMSDLVDWTDRSSCILLGDGAGAAVVSPSDEARIGPAVWGSDPSRSNAVRLVNEWQPRFEQEGQSVFRWATSELPAVALQACERAGVAVGDLAAVVTHQANLRIIEALTKRMGLPGNVVIGRDVVESGNTSAASVPLALSKMAERGELPSGQPVLLFAFGGGLSWAGQVITAP